MRIRKESNITKKWKELLHISIITMIVNGLNSLVKRHRAVDCIYKKKKTKTRPKLLLSTRNSSLAKANAGLKWEDGKKIPRNRTQKQAGIAIFISDKANFKPKLVRRDKEGYFVLIKGIIHQENITIEYI
jgi:hypothetical protein